MLKQWSCCLKTRSFLTLGSLSRKAHTSSQLAVKVRVQCVIVFNILWNIQCKVALFSWIICVPLACDPLWNTVVIHFSYLVLFIQVNSWHTCNITMNLRKIHNLQNFTTMNLNDSTVIGYTPSKGYLLDLFLNTDSLKDCIHMSSWYNFTLLWATARQAKIMLSELSVTCLFSSFCWFFLTFNF